MILSLLALFSFILSLKTRSNIYWFFTPIFLCLAFLCKQTPAAYFGIIIATFFNGRESLVWREFFFRADFLN